jgi:hypothetical protein
LSSARSFSRSTLTGQHDVAALLVELDDLEAVALAEQIVEVAHRAQIDLRTGQEGLHAAADGDREAALYARADDAFDELVALARGRNLVPNLEAVRLLFGDNAKTVFVFAALQEDIDDVSNLDGHLSVDDEFRGSDGAFRLVANVDDDIVLGDGNDFAFDDFAFFHLVVLERLFEEGSKTIITIRGGIGRRRHSYHEYPLRPNNAAQKPAGPVRDDAPRATRQRLLHRQSRPSKLAKGGESYRCSPRMSTKEGIQDHCPAWHEPRGTSIRSNDDLVLPAASPDKRGHAFQNFLGCQC